MRRARLQIERIVERLLAMGFEPASSRVPVFVPPPHDDWLESEWGERQHDSLEPLDEPFQFAPDELHKANISGATHDLWLPDARADPVLLDVAGRPGITLVDYLRISGRRLMICSRRMSAWPQC